MLFMKSILLYNNLWNFKFLFSILFILIIINNINLYYFKIIKILVDILDHPRNMEQNNNITEEVNNNVNVTDKQKKQYLLKKQN